jgi:ribosomal protein S18 acetylase RimI-like enzyme
MAIQIESFNREQIRDDEIEALLMQVYRDGGFTDETRAATVFRAATVRARGEILYTRGDDTSLTGMVILVPPQSSASNFAQPDECELHLLAIAAEVRRQGIGRALVEAAIVRAKQRGYLRMLLWTQLSMYAAQRLYESVGFVRVPARDFEDGGRKFLFFECQLR